MHIRCSYDAYAIVKVMLIIAYTHLHVLVVRMKLCERIGMTRYNVGAFRNFFLTQVIQGSKVQRCCRTNKLLVLSTTRLLTVLNSPSKFPSGDLVCDPEQVRQWTGIPRRLHF